jgi:hypothetical protein
MPTNLSEALELLNWTTPRDPSGLGRSVSRQRRARLPAPVHQGRNDHPARVQRGRPVFAPGCLTITEAKAWLRDHLRGDRNVIEVQVAP